MERRKEFNKPIVDTLNQKQYREMVLTAACQIRRSIPFALREVFDTLSVFRRYNYRLLQQMIDRKIVQYEGTAFNLERDLTATRLVRRHSGFIQDDIARRLLAIKLRWENKESFIQLCKYARDIYLEDFQHPISRPDFIFLEVLYQELQLHYYQEENTSSHSRAALRDRFLAGDGIVNNYLKLLTEKWGWDARDILADLIVRLELSDEERDWEFRFAVNFFLRGKEYTNGPYTELVKVVKEFLSEEMNPDE